MIFVNTSLEVTLERNTQRPRQVPENCNRFMESSTTKHRKNFKDILLIRIL